MPADRCYTEYVAWAECSGMGRSYKDCGGTYDSAIHWDIVKDMRTDSRVLLDDRTVFEDGEFLL